MLSAGDWDTCALKAGGSIICWGHTWYGARNVPMVTDYGCPE
jgi:hypothetical protein